MDTESSPASLSASSRPIRARAAVVVEPGYAIDPSGEEICVSRAVTLTPQGPGDSAVVTLRFWERACSPVPAPGDVSAEMPSRVEEACVIGISPAAVAPAFPLARLLSSEGRWRVDPLFVTPRVGTAGSSCQPVAEGSLDDELRDW